MIEHITPPRAVVNLTRDYRRFLELLLELGDPARLCEEGPSTRVMWDDECLCRCDRSDDSVHIFLGPEGRKAVRCTSYEDFVEVLQRILRKLRAGF